MAQQSQKISNRGKFKRIILRGVLYTVVIPILVMVAIVGGIYLKSAIEANNAQASMKEYLQKKYGQEFVVERPERKGGGLGVEGTLAAKAYPVGDKNLKFTVQTSSAGTEDYYLSSIWSHFENEKLAHVTNIDRGWTSPKVFVSAQYSFRDSYRGKPRSYEDMLKTDGKDLIYTISSIRNTDKLTVEEKDRSQLEAIIDHINHQRVGYRSINYAIYHKKTNATITCNIDTRNANEAIDKQQVYQCFRKEGVSDERY